ncbi:ribonuclease T2 [Trifolium repens]|nr:ribonuclease T2 [Trifolium repens]
MSLITLLLTLLLSLMVSMSKALIYDFLVLSLQWPPALCRSVPSQCTKNPAPPRFGVHGLWPSSYTGYGVVSCGSQFGGVKFDPNVCTDPSIVNDLNNIWPNYLGKNINFWRNEWDKHGTCALEVFDQRQYFENVIDIYNWVDIDYLLRFELNINPDFNVDFDLPMFKQNIAGILAMPQISCSGGNGMPVEIKEIRICLNDVGDQVINCPMADSFSCGTSTVKWYI